MANLVASSAFKKRFPNTVKILFICEFDLGFEIKTLISLSVIF